MKNNKLLCKKETVRTARKEALLDTCWQPFPRGREPSPLLAESFARTSVGRWHGGIHLSTQHRMMQENYEFAVRLGAVRTWCTDRHAGKINK